MAGAEDDIDRLFGLPLEEFVPERQALAKRLRAEGDGEAATSVGKLPKPSVAAWATNQAVRSRPGPARDLWQAADDLAAVQADLIAGRAERDVLQDPLARMRGALEELTGAAKGLLDGKGRDLSEATLQRVGETLLAAATDPGVRADVAAGRAVREASPAGFGLGGAEPAPASAKPAKPKAKTAKADKAKAAKAKQQAEAEARRKQKEREQAERERRAAARKAAKAELAEAKRARAEAERALEEARAREEQAAKALEDAG